MTPGLSYFPPNSLVHALCAIGHTDDISQSPHQTRSRRFIIITLTPQGRRSQDTSC
jgi:hypothetical protein